MSENNRMTDEEQRVTRQYAIDHDAFMKFFKIKGDFQKIEIMYTKTERFRDKDGNFTHSMIHLSNVKPWIQITTTDDTLNFTEDKQND